MLFKQVFKLKCKKYELQYTLKTSSTGKTQSKNVDKVSLKNYREYV